MAPSSSADRVPAAPSTAPVDLTRAEGEVLVDIAEASIHRAFEGRPPVLPDHLPAVLLEHRGAFVTLHVDGHLNGCIGAVRTDEPLAPTVARLARSAAFEDHRLPALRADQLADLTIEVSVLSPLDAVPAGSRRELRRHVIPGVHGVVLTDGPHHGLFLPDVWVQFPAFDDFVDHLLTKAGLQRFRWPSHLVAWRFTTQAFVRPAPRLRAGDPEPPVAAAPG